MTEPPTRIATPRSILLRRVLGCMRDHCHDDTAESIVRRLGLVSPEVVTAALEALEEERFVFSAGDHWQLTQRGWVVARAEDSPLDLAT